MIRTDCSCLQLSFNAGSEFQRFSKNSSEDEIGTTMGYVKYAHVGKAQDSAQLVPYVWMDGEDEPRHAEWNAKRFEDQHCLWKPLDEEEAVKLRAELRALQKEGQRIIANQEAAAEAEQLAKS